MNKLIIFLALISSSCFAQWQVDKALSDVSFVSTKNSHIREVHHIQQFDASIKGTSIKISLDLSSVESGIPIRNERMKSMLFDVTNFKMATLNFSLPKALDSIKKTQRVSIDAQLTLHGNSKDINLDVLLTPGSDGVVATLLAPVIVYAGDFGMKAGIDALQKVAGLSSIGYSVPVYATLTLSKQ